MVISLSGPSGTGKTTLIKSIIEDRIHHPITWKSSSAGDIIPKKIKENLFTKYGYTGSGHLNVIKLGYEIPEFAIEFQELTRYYRDLIISDSCMLGEDMITDRSPIDNLVYCKLQASMFMGNSDFTLFEDKCKDTFNKIDCLINVKVCNPNKWVEDNNSRVASFAYQEMVQGVFDKTLNETFMPLCKSVTEYSILPSEPGFPIFGGKNKAKYMTRVVEGGYGPHLFHITVWGMDNRELPVTTWLNHIDMAYVKAMQNKAREIKWE